jgi:hypothetical protein
MSYDHATKKLIDRRELLKIKFNALMMEAAIIRVAEDKQKRYSKKAALPEPWLLWEMQEHRRGVVRQQARLTTLALGFIRGRTLDQMERYVALRNSQWVEVLKMVKRYGSAQAYAHASEENRRTFCLFPGTPVPAPLPAEQVTA